PMRSTPVSSVAVMAKTVAPASKNTENAARSTSCPALSCVFVSPDSSMESTTSGGATYDKAFLDRKSTRLNSSHVSISYAVFCLNLSGRRHLVPLSLHDALPISDEVDAGFFRGRDGQDCSTGQ